MSLVGLTGSLLLCVFWISCCRFVHHRNRHRSFAAPVAGSTAAQDHPVAAQPRATQPRAANPTVSEHTRCQR